jgi:CBS domain-containing protein
MRHLSDIICNRVPLIMQEHATVRDACEQMERRKIGSVLVTDERKKLIGIFTGRDAVRRVLAAGKPSDSQLRDVMSPDPVTMTPEKTAIDALRLMWDGGFRHVPLVQNGKILGVISRGDFQSDEQLRLDEERQLWEHMR